MLQGQGPGGRHHDRCRGRAQGLSWTGTDERSSGRGPLGRLRGPGKHTPLLPKTTHRRLLRSSSNTFPLSFKACPPGVRSPFLGRTGRSHTMPNVPTNCLLPVWPIHVIICCKDLCLPGTQLNMSSGGWKCILFTLDPQRPGIQQAPSPQRAAAGTTVAGDLCLLVHLEVINDVSHCYVPQVSRSGSPSSPAPS